MALYLDTSGLVKLYIQEEHHSLALQAVQNESVVIISSVGYAEAGAAFARKLREGAWTQESHTRAVAALDMSWEVTTLMEVFVDLAIDAGTIAQVYALRGYDAVHLATALVFADSYDDISFLSFDDRPNEAAVAAGLALYGVAAASQD
jgi:predicted nucleic acid-binding protein